MKRLMVFILCLACIVAGWWFWYRRASTPSYDTVDVSRGDVYETVSASATLVASDEVDLNFEISGRIRSISLREGDDAAAGETLATLESIELDEQVEGARAALDQARAEASANDDALREAVRTEKDAKLYYESVKDLEDQKVEAASIAYGNAKDYEDDAQSYYDQVVSDHGAGSSEAKSAKLTQTAAINSRKSAEAAEETAKKSRDSAIQSAKGAWDASKEKVATIESSARDTIETSAVRSAEAAYQSSMAKAEKTKVKAPVSGKVTKINYSVGEVVGTSLTAPFGRLLSRDFLLEAKISESDVAKVKIGQLVDVSFDSLDSNDKAKAEIIEVKPDATVIQDVVYYIAKLRLLAQDSRLKPGMSADIDIHIAERRSVLRLPARLLSDENGVYMVRVFQPDGSVETRSVSIGIRGDDGVMEILSGLSEGDKVISGTK